MNELIHNKNNEINSNCFGSKYIDIKDDLFNKKMYETYHFLHDVNKLKFVEGTIFFTDIKCFSKIFNFFNDNYLIFFISNMYDNNTINQKMSYIHYLERLFGIIVV